MARSPYVGIHFKSPQPGRRLAAEDLVEAFAGEIAAGHLPPGCRLPPVRALERQLGLSKNTVQAAYDELCARGLLEAREREGVFVAVTDEADATPPPVALPAAPRPRPMPRIFARAPKPGAIALSTVLIDPELLPRERIADCFRSVLKSPGLQPFYDFQGHPDLRAHVARRLRARGMDVSADEILVTVGSQQALDVVARGLDVRRVALEDPVYGYARALYSSHGLALTPLPLDPFGGLDLDAWEAALARDRPGLLYAITSFQNPTGYSYATHELVRVLELAERHEVALFEDDWGSEMLSGSEYRPGLRLLGGDRVLYANSFTKKLLPALRIGFLVARAEVMPALVAAKRLSTLGSPPLAEAALAEFLERGYYDTHLASLQEALDRRYERCLELLRALMPEDVRWTTPGGGPTLWLELPRSIDLPALARALEARGVFVEESGQSFIGKPHLHGFRVSYAFLPEETLERALGLVAEELPRALRRARRSFVTTTPTAPAGSQDGPDASPIDEFIAWFEEAVNAGVPQPEAMTLATSVGGRPAARVVLFRGLSPSPSGEAGLRFFTNYESRKGRELDTNPFAALCFWWERLGRQVRIEGRIERIGAAESDAYFASRPRGHQLGAWASHQSRSQRHEEVVSRYTALEREFEGRPVPRPPHWGGFRVVPDAIEFWINQQSRLHIRYAYARTEVGWMRAELGP